MRAQHGPGLCVCTAECVIIYAPYKHHVNKYDSTKIGPIQPPFLQNLSLAFGFYIQDFGWDEYYLQET